MTSRASAAVGAHSMGGVTVLQLAAAHPDCVAAIVMVDPASLVPPPERRATLEAMAAATCGAGEECSTEQECGPTTQFAAHDLPPSILVGLMKTDSSTACVVAAALLPM